MYLNSIFFWSVSRSQKSIALSSCEAEFISAVSGMADGIYIKRMLEAVLNMKVVLELRIDSSSARALLQRQGVQRTRHISAGLLWVQQKVEEREAAIRPVPGKENSSDLGTKSHSSKRLRFLLGLISYLEYAGGPRVGAQEEEIRRVKGLRPERAQQLTCLLLAALSQQGHGMEVDDTTTGNDNNRGIFLKVFTANAVLFVAMGLAMSVQGCDLALMVLHSASIGAWSLLTEMGYQILQTGMMMVAFNVMVFILFYLRDYFNLRPVQGGGEFQRETSPPQDPHRDGEQRKSSRQGSRLRDPIGQEMATYRVLRDRAQAFPDEEYFLDVDGRLERHGGLGSLSEESSEEEEESAADQPAEEPEGDGSEQVLRVEREPGDEVTDAVRELRRHAGLREELGEHPECYIEYNMPGIVFWMNPDTGETQMHRLLDLTIDTPQDGEEYFVENPNWMRDGGKWLIRRLCYEPQPEEEIPESPRGYGWALGTREWMDHVRERRAAAEREALRQQVEQAEAAGPRRRR